MPEFDMPSLPLNIYQQIPDYFGHLNGWDLAESFPLYLTDYTAMRQVMLQFSNVITKQFPWHKYLLRNLPHSSFPTVLKHAHEIKMSHEAIKAYDFYKDHFARLKELNPIGAFEVKNLTQLTEDRLTQHHVSYAIHMQDRVLGLFWQTLHHLTHLCNTHELDFSFRPIITMVNRHSDTLIRSSAVSAISFEERYYTTGQMATLDHLESLGISKSLFKLNSENPREAFNWWIHKPYHAVIRDQNDPSVVIAIAPAETPSVLCGQIFSTIPVIIDTDFSLSLYDRVITVVNTDEPGNTDKYGGRDNSRLLMTMAASYLDELCAYLTILSLGAKTGKGRARASWLTQPANQAWTQYVLLNAATGA